MSGPLFRRLCIIGAGLIGSSLARLVRERGDIAAHLVVHDSSALVIERVRELGFADTVEPNPVRAVEGCDAVVLCVPVGAYHGVMSVIAPHLAPGCVLSDVGSTKSSVLRDLLPLLPEGVHLVPGHPMAGTEFSGPDAGFAALFQGRWVILTPPPGSDPAAVEKVAEMWRRAGSTLEVMDAAKHDKVVAIVSHLPHLIAFTICSTADDLAQETQDAAFKKGVEMTMNQLVSVMEKLGVVSFGAAGEAFDPQLHNAVMHVEDEALGENVIAEVFQKGFKVGDKVVRFAMVKVAN